jgi:DUF917 family protein
MIINLLDMRFSPNISGGGGNIKELELLMKNNAQLRLVDAKRVKCAILVSRLGKQDAKANAFPEKGREAMRLVKREIEQVFGVKADALLAPEGLGGQLARTSLTALDENLPLVNGDISGGLGIPALSLAHPGFDVLMEEKRTYAVAVLLEDGTISIKVCGAESSGEMEREMREIVASHPMEAIWFASPPMTGDELCECATMGSITNSLSRGYLLRHYGIDGLKYEGLYLGKAKVVEVRKERWVDAEGFSQGIVFLDNGARLFILNEFVKVIWDGRCFRSPSIICAVKDNKPIQSQEIKEGDVVDVLVLPALGSRNKALLKKHEKFWKELGVEGEVMQFMV